MAKGVWIVAEQRDGALRKISFELASTARKLADQTGDEVGAILLGSGIESLAAELGKYGVDKVFVGDNAAMEPYITEAHAAVVAKVVKENDPAILLLGCCFRFMPSALYIIAARCCGWKICVSV